MRWVRLGGVQTLEVLGQSLDLRQVYQLQCVGGKCDGKLGRVMFLFFKLVCCSWGIQRLGILKSMWCVFPRRVCWVRVCSVVA